jgi:hypothetical protein
MFSAFEFGIVAKSNHEEFLRRHGVRSDAAVSAESQEGYVCYGPSQVDLLWAELGDWLNGIVAKLHGQDRVRQLQPSLSAR